MSRQSGFSVLTLLMLVISLATGLAFLLIGAGPNVQGQMNVQKTAQLVAQAQLILHRITKCATDYPAGDNGTTYHRVYPKDANTGAPDMPVALAVTSLVCPGNNQNLWSGVDGVYAPPPIAGFEAWTYTNDHLAVITIKTSQPDPYTAAIAQAVRKIGTAMASSTTSAVADDTLSVKVVE